MKRTAPSALWIAPALILAAGLVLFWPRPGGKTDAETQAPAPAIGSSPAPLPPPPVAAPSTPALATGSASAEPAPLGQTPPSPETTVAQEQTLEAIQDLAVTYDAASVPALSRFLSHSDAEVRAAAREGLIQLGERAAIPYLQEAARRAAPEEAQALREAAEFLALPTWTERRAAQKAKQAAP